MDMSRNLLILKKLINLYFATNFHLIMSNNANQMTILYSDIESTRISSTEMVENDRSQGTNQKIAYPKYDHPTLGADQSLIIQFPFVKIYSYGVPTLGQYFKDDSERSFVKLPLDPSVDESAKLINMLKSIDAHFASEEFASKLLGKKWNKYSYVPIYREAPIVEEDDEDVKKKKDVVQKPKLPHIKLKISTDYTTNEVNTILFKSEMVDGKRVRTPIDNVKTIEDFKTNVGYLSNFRPIVRCVKFWCQPITKKDPMWGATFKIIKGEVEPAPKSGNQMKEFMNSDAFLDSDEDTTAAPTKQMNKAAVNSDSDEVKKPVAVKTTEVKKVAQVESDDDDSEDEKPAIKTVVKQTAKKVESDDDDESEEEKPAPKPVVKSAPKRGGKAGGKTANA